MRNISIYIKRAAALVLSAVILLALFACGSEDQMDPAEKYGYNYRINAKDYAKVFDCNDAEHLKLVNKKTTVSASYAPENIVTLDASLTLYGKEVQLEQYTAKAAEAMITEMRQRGYTGISITSGYRSYKRQEVLFGTYIENEMAKHPYWSREQAETAVLTYSARPGTSEHQSGLCMDLFYDGMTALVNYGSETDANDDIGFAESGAYRWLCENARYFGFILRYPKEKENITGYSYESWHFRFVGVENAIKIWEGDMTLEDFLSQN